MTCAPEANGRGGARRRRRARWLAGVLAAVTVAAPLASGAQDTERSVVGQSAAAAERARAKARQRPGPPPKPVAPFAVEHRFVAEPALGQPLEIELTVRALSSAANVAVTITAPPELALAIVPTIAAAALEQGETLTGAVTLTPLAVGTAQLGVLVEGDAGGTRQARSVSIAVTVTADAAAEAPRTAPAEEPARSDGGQRTLSLPAEERSRR